jgi:DNA-3-methyladenine glycosylase II
MPRMIRITRETFPEAAEALGRADPDFKRLVKEHGLPGLRTRPSGFNTVLNVIAGQQVSTHAARAIMGRMKAVAHPMTPEIFLGLSDAELGAIGFSRAKMSYGRGIAQAILDGSFSFRRVARMADDEEAIAEMVKLKGIGRWSAEVYLLFALRRPDLWPVDDLGVVTGFARLKGMKALPTKKAMMEAGERYRPWRSAAARLLWHYVHATKKSGGGI